MISTETIRFLRVWLFLFTLLPSVLTAQTFRVGSAAADPADTAIVDLLFDAELSEAVASGTVVVTYDPALVAVSENCRSRAGGTIISTHRITCRLTSPGEMLISFRSTVDEVQQILTGVNNFGDLNVSLLTVRQKRQAVTALLQIQSAEFRDSNNEIIVTGPPANPGASVTFVTGWPVDAFELDDTPINASPLQDFRVNGTDLVSERLQSFDSDNDEDWTLYARGNDGLGGVFLSVEALSAFLPAAFWPVVEIYPVERLVNQSIAPVEIFGDCDGAAAELSEFTQQFRQSRLIRVFNCEPIPEGLPYKITIEGNQITISGGIVAEGTVTESGTGDPVQVFVYSDDNQVGVSSPATGGYSLVLLANRETTLSVLSEQFVADSLVVPPLTEGASSEGNDFIVELIPSVLFANGFEDP